MSHRSQAERRANSEKRLLEAFAELVIEQGVQKTTLTDIGNRAGCSHTLGVHLFGSKSALLTRLSELAEDYFAAALSGAVSSTRTTGKDSLLELANRYGALLFDPNPLARVTVVLWAEPLTGTPELREWRSRRDEAIRGVVADTIRFGTADGSIRTKIPPDQLAVAIVGMLRGVVVQMLSDPQLLDMAAAQSLLVRTLDAILNHG